MIKDFREQAEKAERLAKTINDARTCDALLNYARECRQKLEAQSSPGRDPTSGVDSNQHRKPKSSRRPEPARPDNPSRDPDSPRRGKGL